MSEFWKKHKNSQYYQHSISRISVNHIINFDVNRCNLLAQKFINIFIYIIIITLSNTLFAQTNQWRLIWSSNSEADMDYYQLYRSTSPGASNRLDKINHPDTVYIDASLQKGQRYYYRLKAFNTSGLASDFSAEVSAAIPKIINLPARYPLPADTTITLNLDGYVNDPDHAAANMTWKIEGASKLNVDQQAVTDQRKAIITAPPSWTVSDSEAITFTATDPGSFYDVVNCTFVYQSPDAVNKIENITIEQPLAAGTAVISWQTQLPSKDSIQYGLDNNYGNNIEADLVFTMSHKDTLFDLQLGQTYHFRIASVDNTGKTVLSPDSTFTVKQETVNKIENVTIEQPLAAGTAVISWQTQLMSKDSIQYGLDNSYGNNTAIDLAFTTSHEDTLYDLQPDQTYHYRIVSVDFKGETVISPDSTFTVKQETVVTQEETLAYPNPFYAANDQHKKVHFENIPENGTIILFDLTGNVVFKHKEISGGAFEWDLLNNSGKEVRSGLYIYIIQNSGGKELADGKIIIVR